MKYNIGDRSRCMDCGGIIMFVGKYWQHEDKDYRHIAKPTGEAIEMIKITRTFLIQKTYEEPADSDCDETATKAIKALEDLGFSVNLENEEEHY